MHFGLENASDESNFKGTFTKNMFVFSLFTSSNATSLGEAQIGQHIMPFNIILRFVTVCTISYLLLGRVALGAQRLIVIKLSRGRSVGLYVGASVGASACPVRCGTRAHQEMRYPNVT